jgi:MMP 1-O-methyltransferase
MDIENTKKIAQDIDGWLSEKEGELLYNLAKKCKGNGVIVEIGSWKGKSTIYLGQGSKSGNKVKIFAVDPHTGSSEHQKENKKLWTFEEFKRNVENAGVSDIIKPIISTSEESARAFIEPIEFIFIDGAHEYELVKLDFKLWFPKVINGGTMAFHDTIGWSGPNKVVSEFVFKSKFFKNVTFIDSITYGQKVELNSLFDRLRNRYILILKVLFEQTHNLPIPKPIRFLGKKILKKSI